MIETPILEKKAVTLVYLPNGAFDIPTFTTSVAMDYFSGAISLKDARSEFLRGGHTLIGVSSDEELVETMRKSLSGNERFFDYV